MKGKRYVRVIITVALLLLMGCNIFTAVRWKSAADHAAGLEKTVANGFVVAADVWQLDVERVNSCLKNEVLPLDLLFAWKERAADMRRSAVMLQPKVLEISEGDAAPCFHSGSGKPTYVELLEKMEYSLTVLYQKGEHRKEGIALDEPEHEVAREVVSGLRDVLSVFAEIDGRAKERSGVPNRSQNELDYLGVYFSGIAEKLEEDRFTEALNKMNRCTGIAAS